MDYERGEAQVKIKRKPASREEVQDSYVMVPEKMSRFSPLPSSGEGSSSPLLGPVGRGHHHAKAPSRGGASGGVPVGNDR